METGNMITLKIENTATIKKFDNIVFEVSNYDSYEFSDMLACYGKDGYQLVGVTTAKNKHNIDSIYCFFTKEII